MFFFNCMDPHISHGIYWWHDLMWASKHCLFVKYFIHPGSEQNASTESRLTVDTNMLVRACRLPTSTQTTLQTFTITNIMLQNFILIWNLSNRPWESSCCRNFEAYLNTFPHPISLQMFCFWSPESVDVVPPWWSSFTCLFILPWMVNSRLQFSIGHLNNFPWCRNRCRVKWSFLL